MSFDIADEPERNQQTNTVKQRTLSICILWLLCVYKVIADSQARHTLRSRTCLTSDRFVDAVLRGRRHKDKLVQRQLQITPKNKVSKKNKL